MFRAATGILSGGARTHYESAAVIASKRPTKTADMEGFAGGIRQRPMPVFTRRRRTGRPVRRLPVPTPQWAVPHGYTIGDKEGCKICISRGVDLDQRTDWDEVVEWIVDRCERFYTVFTDRLTE